MSNGELLMVGRKQVRPFMKNVVLQEWDEIDGSFVGNVVGGDGIGLLHGQAHSKL